MKKDKLVNGNTDLDREQLNTLHTGPFKEDNRVIQGNIRATFSLQSNPNKNPTLIK